MRDDHNCHERVRLAVEALCAPGVLLDRLRSAACILSPLRENDFPTEKLRQRFADVMSELTREEPQKAAGEIIRGRIGTTADVLTGDDQRRIVGKIIAKE